MLQIKTTKLQELVSKAIKGVGNDKNRPITELIAIEVKGNVLTLTTTDYDNYLYVSEDVESEDFYAALKADQFAKLISLTTSEFITLSVEGNFLVIKGNGNHKIPVELDVNTGLMVEYPNPIKDVPADDSNKIGEITINDIKTIIRAVKPALATTVAMPQYANYYVGDVVLATDTNTASCYGKQITSVPVSISPEVMELLNVYTGESPITIHKIGDRLLFKGAGCIVYGYAMQGVENFAVDKINAYVNTVYPSMCKISKQEMLQTIDRLSIFVGNFDEDTVAISFTENGLQMSSQQSDSVEIIPYIESNSFAEINAYIYLEMLRSQVKAQTGDSIDVYFGEPKSIKFIDSANNITSVVCLSKV